MPTPNPRAPATLALPASATPIAACCVPAFPGSRGTEAATFWAATTTSTVHGAAGTWKARRNAYTQPRRSVQATSFHVRTRQTNARGERTIANPAAMTEGDPGDASTDQEAAA